MDYDEFGDVPLDTDPRLLALRLRRYLLLIITIIRFTVPLSLLIIRS
jgi:hypothetical protein